MKKLEKRLATKKNTNTTQTKKPLLTEGKPKKDNQVRINVYLPVVTLAYDLRKKIITSIHKLNNRRKIYCIKSSTLATSIRSTTIKEW